MSPATLTTTHTLTVRGVSETHHFDDHYGSKHCLDNLLRWCSSVKRLMWTLSVVVMNERRKPLANAQQATHSQIMEAVNSHLEGVKPLFDQVSISVVDLTAQS